MFDRLIDVENRYEEVSLSLTQSSVVSNQELYTKLMKEYKTLTPIVEKYRDYNNAKSAFSDAKILLESGGLDVDFKELVIEEFESEKQKLQELSDELKLLLLPTDPNDDRNVIIEIRGGAGGDEAALFAGVLFRMYSMYSESKRWEVDVIYSSETELGGYKEINFMVKGDGAYSRFKFESGVHRVQRVPETEAQGRIHTSTVTVAVLAEAEEVDVEINTADLHVDTYRASGAGGQHINKTESAIRITHIPTGVIVECQEERSQHKNRAKAMTVLRSRILEMKQSEQTEQIAGERRLQVGSGDRSERIRTYNYPQNRVSDHRIGLTIYHLEQILNGSLDELFDPLIMAQRAEILKSSDGE